MACYSGNSFVFARISLLILLGKQNCRVHKKNASSEFLIMIHTLTLGVSCKEYDACRTSNCCKKLANHFYAFLDWTFIMLSILVRVRNKLNLA